MKRIYLVGAHSVGKTTLANELAKRWQVRVMTEAAREILTAMKTSVSAFEAHALAADAFQQQVWDKILADHDRMKHNADAYAVFDRGPDCLVYAAMFSTIAGKLCSMPETKAYLSSLKSRDSYVFLLEPYESMITPDGVRAYLDMSTLTSITAAVAAMLEMNNIPYIRLMSDNLLTRVKTVMSVVR